MRTSAPLCGRGNRLDEATLEAGACNISAGCRQLVPLRKTPPRRGWSFVRSSITSNSAVVVSVHACASTPTCFLSNYGVLRSAAFCIIRVLERSSGSFLFRPQIIRVGGCHCPLAPSGESSPCPLYSLTSFQGGCLYHPCRLRLSCRAGVRYRSNQRKAPKQTSAENTSKNELQIFFHHEWWSCKHANETAPAIALTNPKHLAGRWKLCHQGPARRHPPHQLIPRCRTRARPGKLNPDGRGVTLTTMRNSVNFPGCSDHQGRFLLETCYRNVHKLSCPHCVA